jgi:RNA polymerase sigma-70 factor (ECF subfamily)
VKKKEFIKLYDQYASKIYRFIYLKVNSPQDSEDLTSEAFFKFWQSLANKNDKIKNPRDKIKNPRALLYRIANNLVTDFYRKKSRTELVTDPEDSILAEIKDNTDLNEKIDVDSDVIEIKRAISQLKSEYQDVIIWHYLDELSLKEIAQIMGKSEGAVRVLIHRALRALRKRF